MFKVTLYGVRKKAPEKIAPQKITTFVAFNIILQLLIFKLFIVTNFRGVSGYLGPLEYL